MYCVKYKQNQSTSSGSGHVVSSSRNEVLQFKLSKTNPDLYNFFHATNKTTNKRTSTSECNLTTQQSSTVGRDSSVGSYSDCLRAGRSGIESRWRRDFRHPSRPALLQIHTPLRWVPDLFPGGKPHLEPKLKKE